MYVKEREIEEFRSTKLKYYLDMVYKVNDNVVFEWIERKKKVSKEIKELEFILENKQNELTMILDKIDELKSYKR